MNYKNIVTQIFCAILFATCNVNCSIEKPFYAEGLSEIYDENNIKYIVTEKFIKGEDCTYSNGRLYTYYWMEHIKTGKIHRFRSDGVPVNWNETETKFICNARREYARFKKIEALQKSKK